MVRILGLDMVTYIVIVDTLATLIIIGGVFLLYRSWKIQPRHRARVAKRRSDTL